MSKLTDDSRGLILADYHTGQYTQRELSKKYEVSTATINKLTKGKDPKHEAKVNALATAHVQLATESEQEVNAVHAEVNRIVEYTTLVNRIQNKALNKADIMLDQIDTPSDLKILIEAVDKAAITLKVADRHAPKIDITQNQAIMPSVNYYAPEKDKGL